MRAAHGGHAFYPLRIRTFSLKRVYERGLVQDDLWVIELSYSEQCDYPVTQVFAPEQRVSIAVRLRDRDGKTSPQHEVQKHPVAASMTRLSVTPIPAQVPVTIRTMA